MTSDCKKLKQGREIAGNNVALFTDIVEAILEKSDFQERIAIMSYGSSGGKNMVATSDTDFTIINDGTLSQTQLLEFQEAIYDTFSHYSWPVAIKAWERVRVNPMDILSLRFLGGNKSLFETQVLNNPEIININNPDILITTLAGVGFHLEFMASEHFSVLVRKYHPTSEFPIKIGYGDVKYYKGGLRWIQQIAGIAMLLSEKRFLSDTNLHILSEKGFCSEDDIKILNDALDFMLAAKDVCVEGNNILYDKNINRLKEIWGEEPLQIISEYDRHINNIQLLFYKVQSRLFKEFPQHEGVLSVTENNVSNLKIYIESGKLELWKNIALRKNIPIEIKELLRDKITEQQQQHPHTMLDEMLSMLDFAAERPLWEDRQKWEVEQERNQWMTDMVFNHLKNGLKNNINQDDIIRYTIHNSFFELYREGKYSDPSLFCSTYLDRVKRFFHCSTIEPLQPFCIAKSACEQILNSGLFHVENITLLELHLTNTCNLDCSWCTYHLKRSVQSLRFGDLEKVIDYAPIEILIAGGGEPTLYRDGKAGFNDVIDYLRHNLPGTRLRLITNGTFIPKGEWWNKIDEVSISLDEESQESFLLNKKKDLFHDVWKNIKSYLYESPLSFIRVTKIYNENNLLGSIALAERLFDLWKALPQRLLKQKSFKFMLFPMADDRKNDAPYTTSCLDDSHKKTWSEKLLSISYENTEFYSFIKNNTNLLDIIYDNKEISHPDRCWNIAHYLLFGADRKIYPCFSSCSHFSTGYVGEINSNKEDIRKKRENIFLFPPVHCKKGCRPSSVFYGLKSKLLHAEQKLLGIPTIESGNMPKIQIVHVSYQDPEQIVGGIGWAVHNLCKAQISQGKLVYWLSPCIRDEREGEYFYEDGLLRVIKIKFTDENVATLFANDSEAHKHRVKFGRCAIDYIKENYYPGNCIVHLHGFIEIPKLSGELMREGFRVLSTFHMLLSSRNKAICKDMHLFDSMREMEKKAIGENTINTVPSESMKCELQEIHPTFKGTILCVRNGISDEHFSSPVHSVLQEKQIVISYGRISHEKGFDILISAMNLLFESIAGKESNLLKLIIFGNIDTTIKARQIYLEQLTRSVQERPYIELLATSKGITGLAKLEMIDQAKFGIIPSLYEPFGMVIPEIMSRGKPVITTLTDGAKDVLQTGKLGRNDFGFVVEPTPDSIAKAMGWMLNHPHEVERMGENALERAKNYQWHDVAAYFDQIYQNLPNFVSLHSE
jgi:glycosyltransferase involved in cell wall biosynthesis/organic radical activating enzyme